jgi:uncharacterized protein YkwD
MTAWLEKLLLALLDYLAKPKPTLPIKLPTDPEAPAQPEEQSRLASALLSAHNMIRDENDLDPLKYSPSLSLAAQKHAIWMAANKTLSHTGEKGSQLTDRVNAVKYKWRNLGENIALGYNTVTTVMAGWMNSKGHKRNIMGSYSEAGFGIADDDRGRRYWVAVFSTPSLPLLKTGDSLTYMLPTPIVLSSENISDINL